MSDYQMNISGSALANHSSCSSKAAFMAMQQRESTATPVSVEIGNHVHHAITGHKFEPAETIAFDAQTSNARIMALQIKAMIATLESYMSRKGLVIEACEQKFETTLSIGKGDKKITFHVTGHIDMLMRDIETYLILTDIKTGMIMPYPQIQLICYLYLMKMSGADPLPDKIGWLFVKRDINTHVEYREIVVTDDHYVEAERQLKNIYSLEMNGYTHNPNPLSCSTCPKMDCFMRAID